MTPIDASVPDSAARRSAGERVRRMVGLALMLSALTGFSAAPADAGILFAADTAVPQSVQEFAWRVIETRCNYLPYERGQRSFWAYDTRARGVGAWVVYSINVLSDLTWKKTEPPAVIEMTIVDDGRVRLSALKASFVVCAP
jgi:hypothetical protein